MAPLCSSASERPPLVRHRALLLLLLLLLLLPLLLRAWACSQPRVIILLLLFLSLPPLLRTTRFFASIWNNLHQTNSLARIDNRLLLLVSLAQSSLRASSTHTPKHKSTLLSTIHNGPTNSHQPPTSPIRPRNSLRNGPVSLLSPRISSKSPPPLSPITTLHQNLCQVANTLAHPAQRHTRLRHNTNVRTLHRSHKRRPPWPPPPPPRTGPTPLPRLNPHRRPARRPYLPPRRSRTYCRCSSR